MNKTILIAALLLPAFAVQAQPSPAKKPLVARILKAQQPQIDILARTMAERPAIAILDSAGKILASNVAPDKREALGKEIQGDAKKYLDEAVPLVRDRALKLAPQTIGAMLEEKFSEDELKQLATFLESPVYAKYQPMGNDLQKSLMEKLLADTRGVIEPKVIALDQSVARRLGIPGAAKGAVPSGPAAAPNK